MGNPSIFALRLDRRLSVLNKHAFAASLLALGRSYQEIARQVIVSTGTIEARTTSINRKLGYAHRSEVVARTRQLWILP